MANGQSYDVAIIGGGIAGLSVALRLPEQMRVALFTKGQLGESNTRYAQGGLAVALGADDNPELHFRDTIAAGAGLCDAQAVRTLVEEAPAAVRWLISMGVQFDRAHPGDEHATNDGLLLGREAAHSRWRVLHAGGDATGAEIERALMKELLKRSSIVLYEETFVSRLIVEDGVCAGLEAIDREGNVFTVKAGATILASGGAGGLWQHTSNPAGATADGLALAWQAGAAVTDLEFMQFHPTVLVAGGGSHLISEAVRGEGAYLRNHAGERFMPRYSPLAELAPRDVVARSILNEMLAEETDCQYLDLRHLPAQRMHERFPTISAICRRYGLDLATDLLPVAPAAHYCMGGVMVDSYGRTTVDGLLAVGEVSCTGVHGANRLASNSLLEGLVFGLRLAGGLVEKREGFSGETRLRQKATTSMVRRDEMEFNRQRATTRVSTPHHSAPVSTVTDIRSELKKIMWKYVSLRRDEAGLMEAKQGIDTLRKSMAERSEEEQGLVRWLETRNMLTVAGLVIEAALQRRESRGSHWRSDFPVVDEGLAGYHYVFQMAQEEGDEILLRCNIQGRRVPGDETPGTLTKEMAHHA
ncbi:MAG TPA: L-aspartate oxidase [Ktedonobacteraceae bacterium]|jgi:L-aspartate oxidase|nr:L-aspartate oxidase [Ktedonobacteraceae bacterium]